MKIILLSIFSLFSVMLIAQEVKLLEFEYSECDVDLDPYRIITRIVDQYSTQDTLFLRIMAYATCCEDFEGSIEVTMDTLHLNYEEAGVPCSCICTYEFTYKILDLKGKPLKVKFMSKPIEQSNEIFKTYPVKYHIFRGDTIGYEDKYGLKQGIFNRPFKNYFIQEHFKDNFSFKYGLLNSEAELLKESEEYFEIADLLKSLLPLK